MPQSLSTGAGSPAGDPMRHRLATHHTGEDSSSFGATPRLHSRPRVAHAPIYAMHDAATTRPGDTPGDRMKDVDEHGGRDGPCEKA